jgi:hypothetical protein
MYVEIADKRRDENRASKSIFLAGRSKVHADSFTRVTSASAL